MIGEMMLAGRTLKQKERKVGAPSGPWCCSWHSIPKSVLLLLILLKKKGHDGKHDCRTWMSVRQAAAVRTSANVHECKQRLQNKITG